MTVVYGGILGQPDEGVSGLLVRELMKVLRQHEVEVIFFNHLRTDSVFHRQVRKIPSLICRNFIPLIQPHWQTFLTGEQEQPGGLISKKQQRDIARCSRNL